MTEREDEATLSTFNGVKVEGGPYTYKFKWNDYDNIGEVQAMNDTFTDKEVVEKRNVERKNNARQKALTALTESLNLEKPTLENSPQLRLRRMADAFKANGETEEDAKRLASEALRIDWA